MEKREIKFRGVTDDNYLVYPDNNRGLFGNLRSWDILQRFSVVNQYTGLNDRNGVEIYEGDIVRGGTYSDIENESKNISIVEFRGHGFWIKDESFGWEGETLWQWDDLEVIGNIYENPELLEK